MFRSVIEQARLRQVVSCKRLQAAPAMGDLGTNQLGKEQSQLAVEALLVGQRGTKPFLLQQWMRLTILLVLGKQAVRLIPLPTLLQREGGNVRPVRGFLATRRVPSQSCLGKAAAPVASR